MALLNYATKEIVLKVVYYGPGLSGKTTNLHYLHSVLSPRTKGKLLSLATEADRTLFFDFLPVDLGKIRDFNIRFQLYTVPGQVRYDATRRLVLKGVDAIVFVADSQKEVKELNIESFKNMRDNLKANNIDPENIPIVFQYNKRDVKDIMDVSELNNNLNKMNAPFFEAVAIEGKGVEETFREAIKNLIKHMVAKYGVDLKPSKETFVSPGVQAPPVTSPPQERVAAMTSGLKEAIQPGIEPQPHPDVLKPSYLDEIISIVNDLKDAVLHLGIESQRLESSFKDKHIDIKGIKEGQDKILSFLSSKEKVQPEKSVPPYVDEIKSAIKDLKDSVLHLGIESQRLEGFFNDMHKGHEKVIEALYDIKEILSKMKTKKKGVRLFIK
ncbi:MAG: GTPase domain-containing protein [Nitrospirae bacterium]|nr:GTPase domain-containing protein [Nitrospirota bacterium]